MVALQLSGVSGVGVIPVVAASLLMVALSLALARWLGLGLSGSVMAAAGRAAVQLVAVGLLFTAIFESAHSVWLAWVWVGVMVVISSRVATRRARYRIEGLGLVAAAVIGLSAVLALAVVFGFGVIAFTPVALVVIAGITIGNAMPATVLATNHAVAHARDHRGELDAALALGFDRWMVVRFLSPHTARTALIPQIERTKVVGLIALPGAMTGMLLAGVAPVDAVVIQLIVMYLILGATTMCVVAVTGVTYRAAVSSDLRAAEWTVPGRP